MELLLLTWLAVGLVLAGRCVERRLARCAGAAPSTAPVVSDMRVVPVAPAPPAGMDAPAPAPAPAPETAPETAPSRVAPFESDALLDALTCVADAMTMQRALAAALSLVRELPGVERATWYDHERARDQWLERGLADSVHSDAASPAPTALLALALRRREVLLAHDADDEVRTTLEHAGALAVVPVLDRAVTVGAIVAHGDVAGTIPRKMLDALRSVLGAVLANARLAQAALERQHKDPLTGLPSVEVLVKSVATHLVPGPVTIALLSMPQMREINLRYGRQAGDRTLAAVARLVALEAGSPAEVGRFGGATLLLVMPQSTLERARPIVARIVDRVGDTLRAGPQRLDAPLRLEVAVAQGAGGDAETLLRQVESRLLSGEHAPHAAPSRGTEEA